MTIWERRYQRLLENIAEAFAYHQIVRDRDGHPIDYILIEVNPVFEKITGLKREILIGQRVSEVLSMNLYGEFDWKDLFREVILKKKAITVEEYIPSLSKWFTISIYTDNPGTITTLFTDITESREQDEKSLLDKGPFSLMDTVPAYIVLVDRAGLLCKINKAMLHATGYALDEVLGCKYVERFIPLERQDLFTKTLHTIIEDKRPKTIQSHILTKDNRELHVQWYTRPLCKGDGTIDYLSCVGIDISDYREVEYRLYEQNILSIALSKARNREETLKECLETALKVTELDCGGIYLLDEKTGGLSLAVHKGLSKDFIQSTSYLPPESQQVQYILEGKKIYTHYQTLKSSTGSVRQKERLKAIAILPVIFEGRVMAVFNMGSHTLDRVPTADRMTLESIAAQLGSYIARINALQEIEERERKYRAAFEGTHDAIILVTEKGDFLDCNQKALDLFGLKSKEDFPVSRPAYFSPVLQPDGRKSQDLYLDSMAQAIEKEEPVSFEWLYQRQDGESFLAEVILTSYVLGEEMVVQSTLRDITQQKKDEESISARNREIASLYSLSSHMRRAKSSDELLPIVLEEVKSLNLAHTSKIILSVPESDEWVVYVGHGHWEAMVGRLFPVDKKLESHLLKAHRPYITLDYSREPFALSFDSSIGPGVFVPLQSEEKMLGMLVVGRSKEESDAYSSSEVSLLTAIGEMAGNALRRQQLHERVKDKMGRLQSLREIDIAITGNKDLQTTLEIVLSQAMKVLRVHGGAILRLYPDGLLKYVAWSGFKSTDPREARFYVSESDRGSAILNKTPIFIPDLSHTHREFEGDVFFKEEGFVAYCSVPLLAHGQVLGLLEVYHHRPFNPEEDWFKFLESLAGQTAIAIDNHNLYHRLEYANMELTLAYDATIEGWVHALDLRDEETEGHSLRVTKMTVMLAVALGIPEEELLHIRRGALLHDIGKMGIPDSILLKPGSLTENEWDIMRLHPLYAWKMLEPIDYLKPALEIPYCHHEKIDGTGYPRGLKGDKIPIEARIFTVVDVYDALTSNRPYRLAWTREKALDYIYRESGHHFDPEVVDLFLEEVSQGSL